MTFDCDLAHSDQSINQSIDQSINISLNITQTCMRRSFV